MLIISYTFQKQKFKTNSCIFIPKFTDKHIEIKK